MNVVVEDDGSNHHSLAKQNRLLSILQPLHKLRALNHGAARVCNGAEHVGGVLQRNVFVLRLGSISPVLRYETQATNLRHKSGGGVA